jgi:hypothetical protein
MSIGNLEKVHEYSSKLLQMIPKGAHLDDWVEDKISSMSDDISEVYHYLDSYDEKDFEESNGKSQSNEAKEWKMPALNKEQESYHSLVELEKAIRAIKAELSKGTSVDDLPNKVIDDYTLASDNFESIFYKLEGMDLPKEEEELFMPTKEDQEFEMMMDAISRRD